MRRNDKEVKEIEDIVKIIDKCRECTIAFFDDKYPYVIPLNFGYEYTGKINLYFHGANEGKKLDLIKKNNKVAFEMHHVKEINIDKIACKSTTKFESINGNGKIEILEKEDKTKGLNIIMKHYTKKDYEIDENILNSVCVFKLKVNEIYGKSFK